ncbi:arabinose 5-phosphate isomerase KdsD [mine drainage metagenome]|uniref:Arabinose 5-phosphate isomerase KdsD n=1 Tax=mine drainage metagenome TaxID=410659 RepID=A0A1J5RF03_9ZZZZ
MTAAPRSALSILPEGRRVIREEAEALLALADSLGESFDLAVERLLAAKGRIAVTGMGKSGLVGRKIAATLASTGSPAFFLHPAEASHGDLGMLTEADILIALSASGESAELAAILSYCLRFGVPVIAVTRAADSMLGRAGSLCLTLPALPEACPLNLAPTTSTTMQLALGDALAVALMHRRGFTPERFHDFHPGGRLGHQLLQLRDVMHGGHELPIVGEDTLIRDGIVVMTAKRFGCVGVVNAAGALTGIFTDGDLRRCLDPTLLDRPVGAVMIRNPKQVGPDMFLADAARIMANHAIPSLFVTEEGRPLGIVHLHDLLKTGLV